ncbi:MAG: cation diffusion facilitator family transporter [Verrucomicrobia bacterium]|nr:cation diffusion facilitator family transporter [Verrucomicrobiota bacterium]
MRGDIATRLGAVSLVSNISFAGVKLLVGFIGNSFALVADGIESLADILSSVIVLSGLRVSRKQADHEHPYGHGKAEAIATLLAGIGLIVSAAIIAYHAIHEIRTPQGVPALFTVPVLVAIIIGKRWLYHTLSKHAHHEDSMALQAEAWHHLSDSLTSLGVLGGLVIAIFAGPGYEMADDLAALGVTLLILYNAVRLIRPALDELMDRRIEDHRIEAIEKIASEIEGIERLETVTVRRSGRGYVAEIHMEVQPSLTVEKSHHLSHLLKDRLLKDDDLKLTHAVMHVEPFARK